MQYSGLTPLPQLLTFANESVYQRGARVLLFVHEHGCTGTLSDQDLALADHVYPMLIGARDILPIAVDRLSAARRQILAALSCRREIDDRAPWPNAITEDRVPPAQDGGDGGHKVALRPAPIVNPPAPAMAIPQPARSKVEIPW